MFTHSQAKFDTYLCTRLLHAFELKEVNLRAFQEMVSQLPDFPTN